MLARIVLACLLLCSTSVAAAPVLQIHATCAADLVRDPAHVRTLRGELARALGNMRTPHTLDVSLVRLASRANGQSLEIRVEVRAMLSDASGRVHWQSTSRAIARGTAAERALLERDAVAGVARDIANAVRTRVR